MIKKSINLNLIDKKKKTNKKPRLHSKKNQGTLKKLKEKKNKTLKKGGAKRTSGEFRGTDRHPRGSSLAKRSRVELFQQHLDNFNSLKVLPNRGERMPRRQYSGATLRESVAVETVIRTWWNNSQNLIPNLFANQPGIQTFQPQPEIEISKKELFDGERKRKISGSDVYGETLYLITLTIGDNTIKHLLKLSVVYSNNRDVYTTIFLCAINETQLKSQHGPKTCKWYELFHISDHPGASGNPSGAIHLKTISDINDIIITLRTFSTTPYVSFTYGTLILVSFFSEQIDKSLSENNFGNLNNSLDESLIKSTLFDTRTIKIDLDTDNDKLFLTSSFSLIGDIVNNYLYDKMSYHHVLRDLGWIRY